MMPTCTRCGLTDAGVIRAENGVPRHVTPMKCIAALKRALTVTAPQVDPVATDALVEKACGAFWGLGWPDKLHARTRTRYRALFRNIIAETLSAYQSQSTSLLDAPTIARGDDSEADGGRR